MSFENYFSNNFIYYSFSFVTKQGNVPSKSYSVFMNILLDTVRMEIAACLESSYDKISTKEAARRLNLQTERDLAEFAQKVKLIQIYASKFFKSFFYFHRKNGLPVLMEFMSLQ